MPSFAKQGRLLTIIMLSSFMLNLTFGVYRSVFSNFAVEEVGITPGLYGLLEGIREVPGLLAMFLLAAMAFIRDERLYALSGGMIAAGIWLYAGSGSYGDLVIATLVQSVGFHMWFVVQDSMVIRTTEVGDRARRLGQINSAAAAGTMLGMVLVLLSSHLFTYRQYFLIFGIIGLAGAAVALLITPAPETTKRSGFVFDWRYRSYYILTLLSGARRHIVLTFASYALVKLHGTPVTTMVTLLMIISTLAIFTRPLIGRIIDKVGEQRALSLNYAAVALVFLGYALIREPYILYGLFVVDNVLTGFDIAISTHAGRIIPKEKLSASLATGTTINHIFGVSVPIAGGVLWEWFGPVVPFLMGVGIVLIAMIYSWNLDAKTARATAAIGAAD
ncbi:MAG: MFS transporter [Bacillota bacterium]